MVKADGLRGDVVTYRYFYVDGIVFLAVLFFGNISFLYSFDLGT